jgi:hypothetical protein
MGKPMTGGIRCPPSMFENDAISRTMNKAALLNAPFWPLAEVSHFNGWTSAFRRKAAFQNALFHGLQTSASGH